MTQQPKAPSKLSSIPVPGGLDLDQLRTIINSLNLLAEQEEGEYLPIFMARLCAFYLTIHTDRMMWEAVGSPPSLSEKIPFTCYLSFYSTFTGPESTSLESSPKSSPKVPLREPSVSPPPGAQATGRDASPERKPSKEGSPMRGTTPEGGQYGNGQYDGGRTPYSGSGGNGNGNGGNRGGGGSGGGGGGNSGGGGSSGSGSWGHGGGNGYGHGGNCGGGGGGGGGSFGRPGPSGVGPEGGECAGIRWYCVTRGRAIGVFAGW